MFRHLSKTIDAVLDEGNNDDSGIGGVAQNSDSRDIGTSNSSSTPNSSHSPAPGDENSSSNGSNAASPPVVEEEEPSQIEYSKLLQLIKAKDFEVALQKMERDTEEYGRFLKQAIESHITNPPDVLEFVIKAKFFDSVRSNNKHTSAVYAVLYMALDIDATEALHFLLIHTSTEFESLCKGIMSSTVGNISGIGRNARQGEEGEDENDSSDLVRADAGREMAVPNALSKIFEAVTRMMDDYAYVETFGLKRTLLILRCIQPVLERHALALMNSWLQSSRFDEYALIIPGNDWKLYEEYQLAKLGEASSPSAESNNPATASNPSPNPQQSSTPQAVPSVRVGGKLDPMKIVLTLDQFSAISQLVETYKTYIRRLYEKGIEEMREKGHSFVDMGETSQDTQDGLPHISNASERVHNIRAYVSEPSQLFMFLQRKSESYKQLESWFLGSALFAAYSSSAAPTGPQHQRTKSNGSDDIAPEPRPSTPASGDREKELRESVAAAIADPPNPTAVFSAQKIDQVFALLLRSMERAVSTKQFDVSLTLIRRAVSLAPSFVLSLFLRHISSSLPKPSVDASCDIVDSILSFHGEETDESRAKKKLAGPKPSSSPGPASLWSAGLGGLMNLVGTNAPTSLIPGSKGISDSNLVNPPKPNIWHGFSLTAACASLNDLALCAKYFPKLHDDIEKKVRYFDRSAENRTAILHFLALFKERVPALFDVASSVQTLTFCLYPAIAYFMHQFYRTSYEIGDEEYRAMELNDPWSAITISWLKTSMEPLKSALHPQVMELWVGQVSGVIADALSKLILRKRFTAFGALAFDTHLRKLTAILNALLPQSASFAVRHKFAALKEVTTILSMENEREILEIWNASHEDQSQFFDPTLDAVATPTSTKVTVKWHLSAAQVKAYMKCRAEWKAGIIDSLSLS